jgi:large subunit ribosomal protein L6
MSRIGKKPVPVLSGVKIAVSGQHIKFEGPKGKLELNVHPLIKVNYDEGKKEVHVIRPDDEKLSKSLHGLTRALINNQIIGVATGYVQTMEIRGVGYKAEMKGKTLNLSVGFANQVVVSIPVGLDVKVEPGVGEVTGKVVIAGPDKQLVGNFAAQLRKVRKPEPYKGKGIRYEGEKVKTKAGKAFAGAGAK